MWKCFWFASAPHEAAVQCKSSLLDMSGAKVLDTRGRGMSSTGCEIALDESVFRGNTASSDGGAMLLVSESELTVIESTFQKNHNEAFQATRLEGRWQSDSY